MAHNEKPDSHIEKLVDKGLEVLEGEKALENLKARKEFLNDLKRGRNIGWRALVRYVLRDYPEEAEAMLNQDGISLKKKKTTPRDK